MTSAELVKAARFGALVVLGMGACIMPAWSAQPQHFTPAGVARLPNILYVIPYAVSTGTAAAGGHSAETIVTIDSGSPGTPCSYQVEWIDFDGATAGFSDNPGALAPPNGAVEFTTVASSPPAILFPFELNVYSNLTASFEGYGLVRSDCSAATKTGVDATFVTINDGVVEAYRQIEPVRRAGNNGE